MERSDQVKFWDEHPTIPYTNIEICKKMELRVPRRFINANKENIDAKLWKLIEPFFNGEGLFLWGKPGVGKTYLCAAIIREYFERFPKTREWFSESGNPKWHAEYKSKPDPILITVPDLFMEIKSSFGRKEAQNYGWGDKIPRSQMNDNQLIDLYSELPVLFLDDIGTEKTTDWSQQTLYTVIDRRYREVMQTVITSNLSLNELSDRTGDRITSRISDMCKVIELKGKDRRVTV